MRMCRRFRRLHRLREQVVNVTRKFLCFCCACGTIEGRIQDEIIPARVLLRDNSHGIQYTSPECDHRHFSCTYLGNFPETRGQSAPNEFNSSSDFSHPDKVNEQSGSFQKRQQDSLGPKLCIQDLTIPDRDLNGQAYPSSAPQTDQQEKFNLEFCSIPLWEGNFPRNWEVKKTLSSGINGSFRLVSYDGSQKKYALKSCKADSSQKEFSLLAGCQSPFVSKLCASFVQSGERYMFMERYRFGNLAQWLKRDKGRKVFNENLAVWLVTHLYAGVDFIHNRGVVHLGIKPTNILIDGHGYPRLSGFGNARRIGETQETKDYNSSVTSYSSPDILDRRKPDILADLWATACCFYEIVKERSPFRGRCSAETRLKITLGVMPDLYGLSPAACDFFVAEFQLQVTRRLGFRGGVAAIMNHRLFDQRVWRIAQTGCFRHESPLPSLLSKTGQNFTNDTSSASSCELYTGPSRRRPRRKLRSRLTGQRKWLLNDIDGYLGDVEESEDDGQNF